MIDVSLVSYLCDIYLSIYLYRFYGKLHTWSLFFTPYFNLVHNFSIMLIWFLTFQCCVNLVIVVISSMEIADVTNGKNKKLISIDMKIN